MTMNQQIEPNPFALLMEPEAIFAAMASSDRLARLKSRICRPLDKPLVTRGDSDASAFDDSVDAMAERDESQA